MECKHCNTEFTPKKITHVYCSVSCKDSARYTRAREGDNWKPHWVTRTMARVKSKAKDKDIPFELTRDILLPLIPDYCPVLGLKLRINKNGGPRADSASLDRIIPELGYVEGNVQVISKLANSMKSNATPEELIQFAQWVKRNY